MTRVIALMALAALGLTEAPVHEPVHDHHSERLMSTTERYHAPCEICRSGSIMLPGCDGSRRADQGEDQGDLQPALICRRGTRRSLTCGCGQVSAGFGFACPDRPVVWMGSGAACSLICRRRVTRGVVVGH
jgi:hypothetical protein